MSFTVTDFNCAGHPRGFGIRTFIKLTRTFFAGHTRAGMKLPLSCTICIYDLNVCINVQNYIRNYYVRIYCVI